MSDAATMERPAAIGHNSAAVGQMVKDEPAIIYRDETVLPAFIAEIKAEIAALPVDLTTTSGRAAIASLSHSISKRKTPIVDAGLALTEGWRKQTDTVNALKKRVATQLDALRDEARAPLTEWEAAEEKRKTAIVNALAFFAQAAVVPAGSTVESIDATTARVEAIQIGHEFGDSQTRAKEDQFAALAKLKEARAAIVKADAERAELEKLRAEAQERERAAQAAEAKRIAEEADRERIANAEKRAAEAAEAKLKAEAEAAIAAERRKAQEAEQALAAEQRRQREAQEAEQRQRDAIAADEARRQADQEHRGAIMRSAKEALMEHGGISEAAAKKVVLAIVAGTIPAVTLKF
jgi:colicin import membrane protein